MSLAKQCSVEENDLIEANWHLEALHLAEIEFQMGNAQLVRIHFPVAAMLSFRARASWLKPVRSSDAPDCRPTRVTTPKTSLKAPKATRSVSRLSRHVGRASPLLRSQSSRSYHSTQLVRSDPLN